MADRSFTQFVPQNAAAPHRPTGKVCAPWQKNRKPDTDTAGSAQKNMAFLCRTFPRVKVRRGKSPVRQTRGFPYRHGLRDGFVLVRPNDVLPEKVRLRVICPAEGRFSGENRLSAQIRPEPGFGGQIHANKEFVRQPRPSPYRPGLRYGLVRQGRGFPYRTKQMPVMGTPPRDDCRPLRRIQ